MDRTRWPGGPRWCWSVGLIVLLLAPGPRAPAAGLGPIPTTADARTAVAPVITAAAPVIFTAHDTSTAHDTFTVHDIFTAAGAATFTLIGTGSVGEQTGTVGTASRPRAGPGAARYVLPVPGPPAVLTPFRPPASRFGPGHRGVDLAADPGAVVRAAGAGTVIFAGVLAGRGVVSVRHGPNLRTTYEPVSANVAVGAPVGPGAVLGRLQAGHPSCAPRNCLHWGARLADGSYLDPMTLLTGVRVRLWPWAGAPAGSPRGNSEPGGSIADLRLRRVVAGEPTPRRSGPGMRLPVDRAEPFGRYMGVDLRSGQAGMSEQLLDAAQIGPAVEQVGGRGVAQSVRSQAGSTRHRGAAPVHQRADGPLVQSPAAPAEEDGRGSPPTVE